MTASSRRRTAQPSARAIAPDVAAYKLVLKRVLDNRPSGMRHRLAKALDVTRVLNSYEISIGMKGNDPARIKQIVQAVTASYLDNERKDEFAQSNGQLEALVTERTNLDGEMQRLRDEQTGLSKSIGVADTGPGFTMDSALAGHGLDNLRSRLAALFGNAAELRVERRDGWTTVTLQVPAVAPEILSPAGFP